MLANYLTFYIYFIGLHRNIKGHKFLELHIKFEELYYNTLVKVDDIATRILKLNTTPVHTYSKYLDFSEIIPRENVIEDYVTIDCILDN